MIILKPATTAWTAHAFARRWYWSGLTLILAILSSALSVQVAAAPAASFQAFQSEMAVVNANLARSRARLAQLQVRRADLRTRVPELAYAEESALAALLQIERELRELDYNRPDLTPDQAEERHQFLVAERDKRRALYERQSLLLTSRTYDLIEAEAAIVDAQSLLAELETSRLTLRAENELLFAPPTVLSIEIGATNLAVGKVLLHRSEWSRDEVTDVDARRIELLHEAMIAAGRMSSILGAEYRDAEQQFVAADRAWQRLNDKLSTWAMDRLIVDALLEIGDFGIGAATNFEVLPAYVLFELVWRGREAALKLDQRQLDMPKLSDEFIAYRDALAALPITEMPTARVAVGAARAEANWLLKGQGEEALKGALSVPLDALFTLAREKNGQDFLFNWIEENGVDQVVGGIIFSNEGITDAAALMKTYANKGGKRFKAVEAAVTALASGRPGYLSNAVAEFVNLKAVGGLLADFAVGAGVNLIKEALHDVQDGQQMEIFNALALAEIDWFVRRNQLKTAGALHRLYLEAHAGLAEELGRALDERAAACCDRILTRTDGEEQDGPIALGWWHHAVGVEVGFSFSVPMRSAGARVGGGELVSLGPVDGDAGGLARVFSAKVPDFPVSGAVEIEVTGMDADGRPLDGVPATVATLRPDTVWQHYEAGSDASYRVEVVRPELILEETQPEVGLQFWAEVRAAPAGSRVVIAPTTKAEPLGAGDVTSEAVLGASAMRLELEAPATPDHYRVSLADRPDRGGYSLAMKEVEVRDAICEPDQSSSSFVVSGFRADAEGWLTTGDAGPEPTYGAGGISASDRENSAVWYWSAPEKFLGNKSGMFGGTLLYRLRVTEITKEFFTADVILEGVELSLEAASGRSPSTAETEYEFALDSSADWIVSGSDRPATEVEICRVLRNLKSLRIRGEYNTGPDTGWLTGVVLGR